MNLTCESDVLEDYLIGSEEIDFSHLSIQEKATALFFASVNEGEFVQKAYECGLPYIPEQMDSVRCTWK